MRAVIARESGRAAVVERVDESTLLEGDVGIDVVYSSLNYKDGGALSGNAIVQVRPLILGIDIVGTVTDSASPRFAAGDLVVLNGARAGESLHGGFAQKARVAPGSLLHVPRQLSAFHAAAIGTAGFTAALAVLALEDAGVQPGDGEVLVTGAAGGTGSLTVNLLARRGYAVVASTGRGEEQGEYLRSLGAARLVDRSLLATETGRPLQSQRWAAAVDAVGSITLANILAQTRYGGTVVSYGLVQGPELHATVLPFILRAVTLTGANSVDAPLPLRERAWALLAESLDLRALEALSSTIGLADLPAAGERILRGEIRGRTVVDVTR